MQEVIVEKPIIQEKIVVKEVVKEHLVEQVKYIEVDKPIERIVN